MTTLLRLGSRGPSVTQVQQLLNSKLVPSPRLTPDGIFGGLTRQAVIQFQSKNWLTPDGIVGPCTLNALRGTEDFVYYKPPSRLVPQPTNDTCWAASTSMLTGLAVPLVIAKAQAAGVQIFNPGGIYNDSDRDNPANTTLFARTFGFTIRPPMSWLPRALAELVRSNGPLMMDTLWNATDYAAGSGSPGHMRVIAGMRGDGTAEGTTMLIYDPWAPNVGKIESVIYGPFIRATPASTYQIFHR
ncbi:MAG TPA: peptidoglycan-binding protein [Pirellulales bacterium]|nr:peptidoglycan-binding protein [Pirellulales bacterium]